MLTDRELGWAATGAAAVGVSAVAVVCCAGLPLLVTVASSVALGTVTGIGSSLVVLVALALVVLGARRRRGCATGCATGSGDAA